MSDLLRVHKLTKHFGGVSAVYDVTFTVSKGQVKSLIGPNGAGKTTCINLISGALAPSSGDIAYMGHSIKGIPSHKIADKGIVRTFQNVLLFNRLTVLENILTGSYIRSRTGLIGCSLHLPSVRKAEQRTFREAIEIATLMGLEPEVHRLASDLPLAKQRAVEIARAVAVRPHLLLLDEPGAGLTPEELSDLASIITTLRKERDITILMVEHNMQLVMTLSDEIVVINFGQLIDEGTPGHIRQSESVIEAYLGSAE